MSTSYATEHEYRIQLSCRNVGGESSSICQRQDHESAGEAVPHGIRRFIPRHLQQVNVETFDEHLESGSVRCNAHVGSPPAGNSARVAVFGFAAFFPTARIKPEVAGERLDRFGS